MSDLPTTGPHTVKPYRCTRCGHVRQVGTNHWGETYNERCPACSWKNPLEPYVTWECLEPPPAGYAKPTPWTTIKLGDLMRETKQQRLAREFGADSVGQPPGDRTPSEQRRLDGTETEQRACWGCGSPVWVYKSLPKGSSVFCPGRPQCVTDYHDEDFRDDRR